MVDAVNGTRGCVRPITAQDVTHLAELIKAEMRLPAAGSYRTGGNILHWAAQWATDTLQVARAHVFSIKLAEGCLIKSNKAPHDPVHVQSRIVTPASKRRYLQSHKEAAKAQVTKVAVRLWPIS
jgi:hypothetical protein